MPKRVIDFDAMWGSDKLASCADWAQAEYAWLYGLADASGCFEITNLRVIWGRVAAIRGNLTIERLEQIFLEFQDKGLLFVWEHEGKRYAHWTGSDVPGRLPPPSWRMRLERFAPPVPKQKLAEYMARFARGRAALAGVGFRGEERVEEFERRGDSKFESSCARATAKAGELSGNLRLDNADAAGAFAGSSGIGRSGNRGDGERALKGRLESTQEQDLDLGLNWNRNQRREWDRKAAAEQHGPRVTEPGASDAHPIQTEFSYSNSLIETNSTSTSNLHSSISSESNKELDSNARGQCDSLPSANSGARTSASWLPGATFDATGMSAKELALARELSVGQGPVCSPMGVKPEVLERIRLRELARAKAF